MKHKWIFFVVLIPLLLLIPLIPELMPPPSAEQTLVTDYGDQLLLNARLRKTMHHTFLEYTITLSSSEKPEQLFLKVDHVKPAFPDHPFESFASVTKTNDLHIYSLQEHLLIVKNNKIHILFDSASGNDPYNVHLGYNNSLEDVDVIEKIILAVCQTKRLKYIEKYSDALLSMQDADIYALARRWSAGDVTEAELNINRQDGYDKQDLISWALRFQEQQAAE